MEKYLATSKIMHQPATRDTHRTTPHTFPCRPGSLGCLARSAPCRLYLLNGELYRCMSRITLTTMFNGKYFDNIFRSRCLPRRHDDLYSNSKHVPEEYLGDTTECGLKHAYQNQIICFLLLTHSLRAGKQRQIGIAIQIIFFIFCDNYYPT